MPNPPAPNDPLESERRSHAAKPLSFTLVEQLVALAIVAVLAAVLLPALKLSKQEARTLGCMNNLRQVGMVCHLYLSDHNRYPAGEANGYENALPWSNLVAQSGITNISHIFVDEGNATFIRGPGDNLADYLYNPQLISRYDASSNCFYQADRTTTSEFITVNGAHENRTGKPARIELARDFFNQFWWYWQYQYRGAGGVHGNAGERINVVYLDGHVASRSILDPDVAVADDLWGNPFSGEWGYDHTAPWF